jgi:hypothetical protein
MATEIIIRSAAACVGHLATSEADAVSVIARMSSLDVHETECTVLRPVKATGGSGLRYVMAAGTIIGSYSVRELS